MNVLQISNQFYRFIYAFLNCMLGGIKCLPKDGSVARRHFSLDLLSLVNKPKNANFVCANQKCHTFKPSASWPSTQLAEAGVFLMPGFCEF